MKRKWELAFSETAYFHQLRRVIDILNAFDYGVETQSNRDGDGDYIYELYDSDGDCIWDDGQGSEFIRYRIDHACLRHLDATFGIKGKPQVIVGDAVKLPLP